MDIQKIRALLNWMDSLGRRPDWAMVQISNMDITCIKNDIIRISENIKSEQPYFSDELFRLKDMLFIGFGTVNPPIYGQIFAILKALLNGTQKPKEDLWDHIHPLIIKSSKSLFQTGHYANAAADAFIEINDRIKKIYKLINPSAIKVPDGDTAMTTVFSPNNPMLKVCDTSTDSGLNEQKGLMLMLQGAMSALRNPKAHANIIIAEEDAVRRLVFASMLMYKIDEAVKYSGIIE